jgi:hypothetical protein
MFKLRAGAQRPNSLPVKSGAVRGLRHRSSRFSVEAEQMLLSEAMLRKLPH